MPAAAAIAGGLSLVGGILGNRAGRREAQRNRRFQQEMRNTQWQAAVEDMKKAGINPALAYSQGPNAAPGGSTAPQSDVVTPGVNSAMAARRNREEVKLVASQAREAIAKAKIAEDQAWMSEQKREYYDQDKAPGLGIVGGREHRQMVADRLYAFLDSEHFRGLAQTAQAKNLADMSGIGLGWGQEMDKFRAPASRLINRGVEGANAIGDVVDMLERLARGRDGAIQVAAGLPRRQARFLATKLREYQRRMMRGGRGLVEKDLVELNNLLTRRNR